MTAITFKLRLLLYKRLLAKNEIVNLRQAYCNLVIKEIKEQFKGS